jgi:hypothetical protein
MATQTDTLADFKIAAPRASQYEVAPGASRGACAPISDVAYIARGVSVKSRVPSLVLVNGSTQAALPLSAIGSAIENGVVSVAEIIALVGADKLRKSLPAAA